MYISSNYYIITSLFLSTVRIVFGQNISTVPGTDDGQAGYIIANEGEVNITVMCTVFSTQTQQLQTPWFLQRLQTDSSSQPVLFFSDGTPSNSEFSEDLFATGELIVGTSDTFLTIFKFLNFTAEFDTTQLECGLSGNRRTFVLGFPVFPSVNVITENHVLTEGDAITINLTDTSAKDPFPPAIVASSLWFEGQFVDNSTNIVLVDYIITIDNVQRNMSGVYVVIVSNLAGSSNGSFVLNVQFPSEATSVSSTETVLAGPDGQPQNNGGRFNTTIPGQLTITDGVVTNDNGTYTCNITNGIGQALSHSVDLIIASKAGSSQNVTVTNITDNTVTVSWSPPMFLGIPELSYYELTVIPLPPGDDIVLTTVSTSLIVNNFDILLGTTSDSVTIATLTGAPSFNNVNSTVVDGNVLMSWTLKHTGGLDIDIFLYCDNSRDHRATKVLLCQQDECYNSNNQLMGSTLLGPIVIDEVYTCSIIAVNTKGIDTRRFDNITSVQGLPSVPFVVAYQLVYSQLSLTLKIQFAGNTDKSFRIIAQIYYSEQQLIRINNFLLPFYNDDDNVTINISQLPRGSVTLIILAANSYGNSINTTTLKFIANELESVSIVSSTTEACVVQSSNDNMASGTQSDLIVGSVVGLLILSVIGFVVVLSLLIVLLYYRKKGVKTIKSPHDKNNNNTVEYEVIELSNKKTMINTETNVAYGEIKPVYM